ncbi:MAG: 7-cyano-7-deazaguanine synthase QueC [Thiotrichales bacterium]|jgi:7-cyano-7-deazaguanine synthase|nr:7-cyano-7-deazaguanine synthase QueC [Thiotrichales bacterium]
MTIAHAPIAVVLLSGGLDSATTLALAKSQGYLCHAISFNYGQRHAAELAAAKRLAQTLGAESYRVVNIDLAQMGGSALTDDSIPVPETATTGIPLTYVPARNTVFLSYALALAEVLEAQHIFIGVNAVDYSGYPDCRPEFIAAFEQLANLATRSGVEGKAFHIHAPLQHLSKAQIVQLGTELGVDFSQTVSCYQADDSGKACGRCDACRLRREGFLQAGLKDVTLYQTSM